MFLYLFIKKYWFVLVISILFAVVPFFWFGDGEMDLGGDSDRLYFYDPIAYAKISSVNFFPEGRGKVEPYYYYVPYSLFLAFLKFVVSSPTLVIAIINAFKLVGGFLGIFWIVRTLLYHAKDKHMYERSLVPAVFAGVFYIASFCSFQMEFFWDRSYTSHNQIFLNPIIFYLLLQYLLTKRYQYLHTLLLMSFIFSPNFAFTSAPPFFAFYPLAVLFLIVYVWFTYGRLPWKQIGIGLILFIGVQSFHLIPQILSLLDSGSYSNNRVFNQSEIEAQGVQYFNAVSGHGKAILNWLMPSPKHAFSLFSLFVPIAIVTAFLMRTVTKLQLLVVFFFIATFFLATANITSLGLEIYKRLFYIPGFSMFRVFFIQWKYVFIFFYSILFGISFALLITRLRERYARLLIMIGSICIIVPMIPFLLGTVAKESIIRFSNNVRTAFVMDPEYLEVSARIARLPDDGKILVLPLTDTFRQVVSGQNGGAYEGPSMISHVIGKYSFVGYQFFGYEAHDPAKYAEDLMKYSREKQYDRMLRIFRLFNIRYILHNTDTYAFEEGVASGDYAYMNTSFPKTTPEYQEFISQFPFTEIYRHGPFVLYEIHEDQYNHTIFTPKYIYQADTVSFDVDRKNAVFISPEDCKKSSLTGLCLEGVSLGEGDISFSKIHAGKYIGTVQVQSRGSGLFFVMQHQYHKDWKMFIDGKQIDEQYHVAVNGYANGWYVDEASLPAMRDIPIQIYLTSQDVIVPSSIVTGASLGVVLIWAFVAIVRRYKKDQLA